MEMKIIRVVMLLICLHVNPTVEEVSNSSDLQTRRSRPSTSACTKQCSTGFSCEEKPCTCQVCVKDPLSCKTFECRKGQKCRDTLNGPVCVQMTCADIQCEAGFLCNELPDGPDCVPDVPTCKNFYCNRGTNCYIRAGSPICLPNTCAVRECRRGLSCVDTPYGALCRKGKKKHGCKNKYCPENSTCEDNSERGPVCVHI